VVGFTRSLSMEVGPDNIRVNAIQPGVVEGERIDRIILTGGMARSSRLVERLTKYLSGLPCGITVYAGENEMIALARGALRVLYGKETPREYPATELAQPRG